MKKLMLAALAATMLAAGPATAAGDLFIYNWTDYTPPDLIKKFEAETGIKVTLDTYDSNETLIAKLKAGGTGYDIAIATNNWIEPMIRENLIQPINAASMSTYANLDEKWRSPPWDKDNVYSVPYQWGFTSFAVNTKAYTGDVDTLKLLFEPPAELQGQIGMLNSASEAVTMAQVYLGQDFCQTDVEAMKKVQDLLLAQKPFVKVYNSDGIIERMGSGETRMHQAWNGNTMRAREANADVRLAFPKEGVVGWMDNLVIPAGAKNPENAKKFIEFMLKPENAAAVSNFARYANGIKGADTFMDKALADAPELKIPADLPVKWLVNCNEDATKLIDRVWTRVKG